MKRSWIVRLSLLVALATPATPVALVTPMTLMTLMTLTTGGCGDDGGAATAPPNERRVTRQDAGTGDNDFPINRPDDPPTGMPPEGILGGCGIDSNKVFEIARTQDSPLNLPIGIDRVNSRAALVYIGDSVGCSESLYLAGIEGDANELDAPEAELAVGACDLYADPAVTWAEERLWLMAFVDNRVGNEVWTKVYDEAGDHDEPGFQISEGSQRPGMVAITTVSPDRRMVVWAERSLTTVTVMARPVDTLGEPVGPAQLVTSFMGNLGSIALSQLGMPGDGLDEPGALVAYWRLDNSGATDRSELVVQALDLDGKLRGDERVVREDVGNSASIAATLNHTQQAGLDWSAGAVAYSVSQTGGNQLWFQLLDNDGQIGQLWDNLGRLRGDSAPQRLVNSPQRAVHASVARVPQGYMVAYRALPGGDVDRARIRVVFLNRSGEFDVDSDVAFTTEEGGPTQVLQGSDGRSVILWSELDAETGEIVYKVARMPCP